MPFLAYQKIPWMKVIMWRTVWYKLNIGKGPLWKVLRIGSKLYCLKSTTIFKKTAYNINYLKWRSRYRTDREKVGDKILFSYVHIFHTSDLLLSIYEDVKLFWHEVNLINSGNYFRKPNKTCWCEKLYLMTPKTKTPSNILLHMYVFTCSPKCFLISESNKDVSFVTKSRP